jgi:hypothetical protein
MGFIANKLGDRKMVRFGLVILAVGLVVLALPWGYYTPLFGLLLVGLGCAPVYPSLIHETPNELWQRTLARGHRHPDGDRLCWLNLHAAVIRLAHPILSISIVSLTISRSSIFFLS